MKVLLWVAGVLGLAAAFELSEPASASATPVMPDTVRVTSERVVEDQSGRTCIAFNPKGRGKGLFKGPGRLPLE